MKASGIKVHKAYIYIWKDISGLGFEIWGCVLLRLVWRIRKIIESEYENV